MNNNKLTNVNSTKSLRIGDIYLMKFDGNGSEQNGWRPGLVFQNNKGNDFSPNIIALPLTSSIKKVNLPTHVLVSAKKSGLMKDSVILCENPQRMSKNKVGRFLTTLSNEYMEEVAVASLIATGGISFINPDNLLDLWESVVSLNATAVA